MHSVKKAEQLSNKYTKGDQRALFCLVSNPHNLGVYSTDKQVRITAPLCTAT